MLHIWMVSQSKGRGVPVHKSLLWASSVSRKVHAAEAAKYQKDQMANHPPKLTLIMLHTVLHIYIFVVSCTRPGGCDLPLSGCIVRSVEARLKKFFMRIVGAIVTLFPSINEDLLT